MIGKLAVWAPTREQAIARLRRALSETIIKGITTNTQYLKGILELEEFARGDYDTGLLSRAQGRLLPRGPDGEALSEEQVIALAAAAIWQLEQDERAALVGPASATAAAPSPWAAAGRISASRRS
jgi:acetyl-CoA carboxylase biotin carboxylase subunit